MDSTIRQPLQGTINIIRFNWPLYVAALSFTIVSIIVGCCFPPLINACLIIGSLTLLPLIHSLFTSWFVYDRSPLYRLPWLLQLRKDHNDTLVNINAGFDETSEIIRAILPHRHFYILDFYDPTIHTEASIRRARKLYPSSKETQIIKTRSIPLADNAADKILIIFSAHEIRDEIERICFFKELRRILKPGGQIFLTEHLRDAPNFFAYNIGFLHFYSENSWQSIIEKAGLYIAQKEKTNAFITTFTISKNGVSS